MPDFTYDKEEILELIVNVLISRDSSELEKEAVEQEVLADCQTAKDLANKYNITVDDEDECKVVDEDKWIFEFEENLDD